MKEIKEDSTLNSRRVRAQEVTEHFLWTLEPKTTILFFYFYPPLLMADNGSGMNAIVAVIAVIAIVVIGYFAIMMLQQNQNNDGPGIEVDLNGGGADGGAQ